jgi:hypothetical protein
MIKIDVYRIVQWCSLAFAVFTIFVSLFLLFADSRQTVVFDGTRLTPEELTVEKGMHVMFRNESHNPFWPASNLHPYHTVFPSFDPKEPILPGGSWEFIFDEPGTWSYHDHIHPHITGVIKVKTVEGIIPPQKCETSPERAACQEKDMLNALHEGGIPAAFDMVSTLFNREENFKQECHEILHSLGREAYNLYANGSEITFSEVTKYCGYGFFHGFIEGVVARTGSLEEAQKFCEGFKEQDQVSATEACYHGIGHGVLDGSDPRTWGKPMAMVEPALLVCLKVSEDEEQQSNCALGVFNALADFAAHDSFGLYIPPNEAYAFCRGVEPEQFKIGCYSQMNVITGYRDDRSFTQSLEFLKTITEEEYLEEAVRTMAGSQAKATHTQSDYEDIVETCHTLEADLRFSCVQGYVGRLMDFGVIGEEYMRGVEFCNSVALTSEEKYSCVDFVGRIAGLDQTIEIKESRCSNIREKTGIQDISCEPYQSI